MPLLFIQLKPTQSGLGGSYSPHKVAFLAIIWVDVSLYLNQSNNSDRIAQDRRDFQEILLTVDQHKKFSLSSLRAKLEQKGIEKMRSLEVFDPTSGTWDQLLWSLEIGPVAKNLDVFLLRYDGITTLAGFVDVRHLACRLPRHR